MMARKVLGEGGTLPAGLAADASVPLKELTRPRLTARGEITADAAIDCAVR